MALTAYTSYAEIRAAIGVDADELPDATLAVEMFSVGLLAELQDVDPDLPADFAIVVGVVEASRTAVQAAFYNAVKLFAPYAVGVALFPSLPMFAPKALTDGKAGTARFSDGPYKETIKQAKAIYDRALARLRSAYAIYGSSTDEVVPRTFFTAASPSLDPVVGE